MLSGAPAAAGLQTWREGRSGRLRLSSTWESDQTSWTTTAVPSRQRWPRYGKKGAGLVWQRGCAGQAVDGVWLLFVLRVPQDCFSSVPLLAHDPDGDQVKCSFGSGATVPLNVSLDQVSEESFRGF